MMINGADLSDHNQLQSASIHKQKRPTESQLAHQGALWTDYYRIEGNKANEMSDYRTVNYRLFVGRTDGRTEGLVL
jgi:hypothetical protein